MELLLQDEGWLTDKHINAANKLLSNQFPNWNGFQDPVTLTAPKYPYKSKSCDFIQIVNIDNKHWACIANVLSAPGVVEVYDSFSSYSIRSSALHMQVAKILKTSDKSFQLKHVGVQQQRGADDCALFAIANATTLCFGSDPHITSYVQKDLRVHLRKCFEAQHMSFFPQGQPRRLGRKRMIQSTKVDVFCVCRLPWNKRTEDKGALVQCQICEEWFHQVCMEIDENLIEYPALKYNCKLCLGLSF